MKMNTSSFRSRWLPQIVCVAVACAGAALGATAGPGHAAQLPDEVLPSPGKIRAVAVETARSGWPHPSTLAERDAETRKVLLNAVPRRDDGTRPSARVLCRWPSIRIDRARCRVEIMGRGSMAGQVARAFDVRVRVYEDASWTMHRIR